MGQNGSTSLREADNAFERKKRTILFLSLGFVLYIIADITGKWFVPEGESVPTLFSALVWCISIALGFILYYGFHKIHSKGMKIAAALVFYIIFLVLLSVSGFYRFENSALTGYRISVTILPVIGALICMSIKKFIRWYGAGVKRLFHLETTHSAWFFAAFLVLGAAVVLLFTGGYKLRGSLAGLGQDIYEFYTIGEINHNTDHSEPFRQYDRIFDDLNDVQMEAARKNGLKETLTEKEIAGSSKLKYIESNRYYDIDELTHSVPYLVPKAADLVEDIGRAFQDSLFNRGYSRNHRITVTSVLRTKEQVRQLRRNNVNSTENSCHCYGTTIDISYLTFSTPDKGRVASQEKMRQVLMQVVYDLRQAGRCYVKYEKQQTCLHITVR